MRQKVTGIAIVVVVACVLFVAHVATNGQYGFHRDELATVADAKHLAWGYVAYPPVTPFFGRVAISVFGDSLRGIRLFPALALSLVTVLAALMARLFGGGRLAQVVAALATAACPVVLAAGALYQYVAFDFFWWVLIAYLVTKLIATRNERLWLALGAVAGLGLMTKYSILFFIAGALVGFLFTPARELLRSRWLLFGIALAVVICLPNVIWQFRHEFVSLDFLKFIHARDMRIGRTSGFIPEQFWVASNLLTVPLWVAGLYYFFFHREGKRFAVLGWMYVVPLAIFIAAHGRSYYLAPAYPMLLAGGAVLAERWVGILAPFSRRAVAAVAYIVLALAIVSAAVTTMPIAPIESRMFASVSKLNGDFVEEIGWPDLVAEVARVYQSIPAEERSRAGILALNYGEAGAIELYGGKYDLPQPISGTNSYWYRGYGNGPETVVLVGGDMETGNFLFERCELAGRNTNRYGVLNEETKDHPEILLCRNKRRPWSESWPRFKHFG